MPPSLDEVRDRLLQFRRQRDWEQFHDPKNLAEALAIEAAELLEVFLWKKNDSARDLTKAEMSRVREEAADIFAFLIYLCEELQVDLLQAVEHKIRENERKYPVAKSKGSGKKYTEL